MKFPKHVQELLEKRYLLKGEPYKNYYGFEGKETWRDLANRVAIVVSKNNPEMYKPYFDMISNLEFLPNSPTLFGAGVPGICLSACFIAPMEDSIEGWANTFRVAMKIQTAGGGIGFPLHKLRPAGSPVRGKIASAAGPIEFVKCWNQISKSFMQAVRNGANLGQLHISHPDTLDFIECKDKDGDLSSFNISLLIPDSFMEQVKKDGDWSFMWNNKTTMITPARVIWDKICEHAWKTGEPGIIFWDQFQKNSPDKNYPVYSNPCLHGESLILTKEYGLVKIGALPKIKDIYTFDFDSNEQKISKVWNSGVKECVEITLLNGQKIICTPDHKFLTSEGKWEDSSTLLNKELFRVKNCEWEGILPKEYKNHDMTMLGFILGDGSYHKDSKRVKYVYFGNKDYDVESYFKNNKDSINFKFEDQGKTGGVPIKMGYCDQLFDQPLPKRHIPDFVKHLPKPDLYKFLKGLYSANGYVIDDGKSNKRICIKMVNKHLISEIQELLSICDIDSKIQVNKGKDILFENGIYECKDSYSLSISDYESCVIFRDNIGFLQIYKNIKLENMLPELKKKSCQIRFNKVISIEPCGEHIVYDFTQNNTNCGNLGGHITHNCGEFSGVELSSCNLGAINLMKCLDENGVFSYIKFEKLIRNGYMFLDDLIDVNQYPTLEIDQVVKDYRQIGLGTMGLADLFVHFDMVYGSKKSQNFTQELFEFKQKIETEMNESLGKSRGKYPNCSSVIPLRNANMSVQAPTGTTSMIAGVSASIEPIFSFEPITRMIGGVEKEVFAPKKSKDPKVNVCANDISVETHVEMTGIVQKYVDMSISKTINLPHSATIDDVKKAFEMAFEHGLKGVTVYRDGSRDNQTIQTKSTKEVYEGKTKSIDDKERKFNSISPIKRPKILSGKTFNDQIACGHLFTTINFDNDGNMLEVFISPGKGGGCKSNVEGLSRLISIGLRSGIKVSEIQEQLKGIQCSACIKQKDKVKFTSCADSISKAMGYADKHKEDIYIIKEKVKEIEEELELSKLEDDGYNKCPECEAPIILEAGCKRCRNCGWSKCG